MKLTEEKIFSAFGLEQKSSGGKEPADAGQDGQGEEDQKPRNTDEGNERDGITEAETDAESGAEDSADEEEDPSASPGMTPQGESQEQSPEERRANAARRRQQEQQAAIREAVQAALKEQDDRHAAEMKDFFEKAQLTDPISGKAIRNMEDFRAWQTAQEQARIQKELKDGKLTEETLSSLIERNPTVQAARKLQEQQEALARQQREEAQQREIERQLNEIRKVDPSIRTVKDLMSRPYSREFYAAVQRGNNFEDAFYLATRKQKEEATTQAAQQAAMNNIRSKDHLRATNVNGRAGATVTAEEEKMYRLFNPNASAEEIQRFQNKYRKQ